MNVNLEELKNIIDDIQPPSLLSNDEYDEIVESAGILICDMIRGDPMMYIYSCFEDIVRCDTSELLRTQLQPIFDFDIDEYVDSAVIDAMKIYHTCISPRRSYDPTFIRKKPCVQKMSRKIDYLENIPQPEQRTTEWYLFRHRYLTASSIWKAFGTQRAQNELIYDKCRPIDVEKYKNVNTETPMHWGQKYEDVSIQWYNNTYKTNVSDFGCIPHRNISYLAASPDGINTDKQSELYGRMLEVKNIVNREIDGIPKQEYWIQMQLQMEVCELDECDFLETRFIEYENANAFYADGDFQYTENGKHKGIIMMFNNEGNPLYEYMPYGMMQTEYEEWESKMMKKHEKLLWIRNDYWYMDQVSCVLVLRNKMWFNHVNPVLDELWRTIDYERENGYEHRAPNRKAKKCLPPSPMKCFIEINVPETENSSLESDKHLEQLDNHEIQVETEVQK
jgi:putative phage-type endonuclease